MAKIISVLVALVLCVSGCDDTESPETFDSMVEDAFEKCEMAKPPLFDYLDDQEVTVDNLWYLEQAFLSDKFTKASISSPVSQEGRCKVVGYVVSDTQILFLKDSARDDEKGEPCELDFDNISYDLIDAVMIVYTEPIVEMINEDVAMLTTDAFKSNTDVYWNSPREPKDCETFTIGVDIPVLFKDSHLISKENEIPHTFSQFVFSFDFEIVGYVKPGDYTLYTFSL